MGGGHLLAEEGRELVHGAIMNDPPAAGVSSSYAFSPGATTTYLRPPRTEQALGLRRSPLKKVVQDAWLCWRRLEEHRSPRRNKRVIFRRDQADSPDGGCVDLVIDLEATPAWRIDDVRYWGFPTERWARLQHR